MPAPDCMSPPPPLPRPNTYTFVVHRDLIFLPSSGHGSGTEAGATEDNAAEDGGCYCQPLEVSTYCGGGGGGGEDMACDCSSQYHCQATGTVTQARHGHGKKGLIVQRFVARLKNGHTMCFM